MSIGVIQQSEGILFALRSLYDRYGYSRYKMNKFEEYDLYARNKDFLISDGVITFTDTNGKLMALKPDVTLSIVKNTKDDCTTVQKLYYDESVYRVSKGTHSFKEITQVGLEAMGNIDGYCIYEVLRLAADSLECTGRNCILEFSHLGIISDTLDYVGIPAEERARALSLIGEKNAHELAALCDSLNIEREKTELLKKLVSVYGSIDGVLSQIAELLSGVVDEATLADFTEIANALNACDKKDIFRIDFSIVSDIRYYNGFVFRGFAQGLPNSVLSGGQYDTLMAKMKKSSRAIGFAVYLDMLEQLEERAEEYDVENLLIYGEKTPIAEIERQTSALTEKGESFLVQREIPEGIKYKKLIKL